MTLVERLPFRSLRGVITAIILVVVGGSVALTAFALMLSSEEMLAKAEEARTRLISSLTMQAIKEAMLSGGASHLYSTLEQMRRAESISNIRLINPDGRVEFDAMGIDSGKRVSFREYSDADSLSAVRFARRTVDGRATIEGLQAIRLEGACRKCHIFSPPTIAYLSIVSDIDPVKGQVSEYRALSLSAIGLTLFGVGLALSVIMTHMVTNPLRRLATRVRSSAEYVRTLPPDGELDLSGAAVPVEVEYEVGHLAESFNELLSALERSHREIRRLHEMEMERAGKMATIGELASSIAHEIRNPLAGILGAVEVIEEDLPEGHAKKAVTQMMKDDILRLNRTLTNLLSYAKPHPLAFRAMDLGAVAEKAIEFVRMRMKRQNVDLTFTVDAGVPLVQADEDGIMQVLMNVLLNALDAMPAGGPLAVHISAKEGRVRLDVIDSGGGMTPQQQASLFKPFFTTKVKGTGLGLVISKRIIDAHGGEFTLVSRNGHGTTASISLPATQEAMLEL